MISFLCVLQKYFDSQGVWKYVSMKTITRTSPFLAVQQEYGAMLDEDPDSGRLRAVFYHYVGDDGDQKVQMVGRFRKNIHAITSQIWWWFELLFEGPSLSLLAHISPDHPNHTSCIPSFWDLEPCCKHPHCERKLMSLYNSMEELRDCPDFKDGLRILGKYGKICNMHLERLMKEIKGATQGKLPMLERLLGAGSCTFKRPRIQTLGPVGVIFFFFLRPC